jgi:tRNA (guanine37-N1)-methyltransferase
MIQEEALSAPDRLRFDLFTLFPAMFQGPFNESIVRRAVDAGRIEIHLHDLRDWARDRHRTVDDRPYGGGAGMVLMVQPIVEAVEDILGTDLPETTILAMSAGGQLFDQSLARSLASANRIAIICGHYEGFDQRAIDILGAREVSIGNYVLTGGELPAMVIVDAVTRLVPGVLNPASITEESHGETDIEYPHFTRPERFREHSVPEILLSGHHAEIRKWREEQSRARKERRNQQAGSHSATGAKGKTQEKTPGSL